MMNQSNLINSIKNAIASTFLAEVLIPGANPFSMQANNGIFISKASAVMCGDKISLAACGEKISEASCGNKG